MSKFTAPSVEELQSKFPNHHIHSFIAQGGMGAVYLATQKSLDREVAIKILPQEFGEDKGFRTSFETEAKAMAKLNHTNLVGIYDFGAVDGMLYIIMEYIPGRTLFESAHGQAVEQLEAARLIVDMCQGLDHAHSAGMLHRDIKPANVLIDDEARPKIVDFGLARPLGEEQAPGVVFGTPGYTAPEVVTNPSAVDQRSDIYSMGAMLYELLTGRLPGNPIIPASKVSGSNVAFDQIINKAIHRDPAQRYHTVGEMADALEELITKFEKTPGLLTLGTTANRSKALGGIPMTGGVKIAAGNPVVTSRQSGGNVGLVLGLIATLIVVVIVIVSMGDDEDKPQKPTAAELEAIQLKEQKELQAAEEKRMAEVARKRREQRELEEEKRIREERREARRREKEQQEKALAEEERRREQQRLEEERKRAMAEAEAQKSPKEVPVYDHESFIAKERADISVRAATVIRDHRDETNEILDREERDAKRAARRSAEDDFSDLLESKVEVFFKEWKKGGDLPVFPEDTPDRVIASLNEFMVEIKALDKKRLSQLTRYQDTYAEELQKKARLLEKENVTASVEAIQAELAALAKKGYFLAIVKSENPKPDTYEEELEERGGIKLEGEKDKRDRGKRKRDR